MNFFSLGFETLRMEAHVTSEINDTHADRQRRELVTLVAVLREGCLCSSFLAVTHSTLTTRVNKHSWRLLWFRFFVFVTRWPLRHRRSRSPSSNHVTISFNQIILSPFCGEGENIGVQYKNLVLRRDLCCAIDSKNNNNNNNREKNNKKSICVCKKTLTTLLKWN